MSSTPEKSKMCILFWVLSVFFVSCPLFTSILCLRNGKQIRVGPFYATVEKVYPVSSFYYATHTCIQSENPSGVVANDVLLEISGSEKLEIFRRSQIMTFIIFSF